ncbi:tetratricopeptide repeat protein [Candidatus Parabeggiatoa sp. HSG14]|uniref:tetratricopeptide repeat protein n=1 Tax=Candidatus Parabeggiatoa sp. HSG14 TaxID=3055593 RepID=UPI0025A87399|nr:tetratricopeptide repeat protein [Thiotrichales bacterium HSG14]
MPLELNLYFPDSQHVSVRLIDDDNRENTELLSFTSPLSHKELQQLGSYLKNYATHYNADEDAKTAQIVKKLPSLGKALFNRVFSHKAAYRLFKTFQNDDESLRLLSITTEHPAILGLPWELLHETGSHGNFLVYQQPRISIRRRLSGYGQKSFKINPKKQLHLLFVISNPSNVGFFNHRANAQAVLNALDKCAADRVTVEFLRPQTLKNLRQRLEDENLPRVDILHFDGIGILDKKGDLVQEAKIHINALAKDLKTTPVEIGKNTAYLLFEKEDGKSQLVPAPLLANVLNQHHVSLVVLSARQSANEKNEKENINSVATQLTTMGVPFVLAMRHSALMPVTQKLFERFYEGLSQGQKIGVALDNARVTLFEDAQQCETGQLIQCLHDWFIPVLYQQGQDKALLTQLSSDDKTEFVENTRYLPSNIPPLQKVGFFGRDRELGEIEYLFGHGKRRVSINGIGGQGKTCLVQETGRWLQHNGMFKRVVFIDYTNCQGLDPVSVAVSTMASVFQKNLLDADAATYVLRRVPTLLILDNLEAIALSSDIQEEGDFHQGEMENSNHYEHHSRKREKGKTSRPFNMIGKGNASLLVNEEKEQSLITDDEDETHFVNLFGENDQEEREDILQGREEKRSFISDEEGENETKEHRLEKSSWQAQNKEDALRQLLDVAQKWSESGQSCVLITTRQLNLHHPAFPKNGNQHYYQMSLNPLEEKEALRYFDALMKSTPERLTHGMPKQEAVEDVLERINYHPLSINLLACQLQKEQVEVLSQRLRKLLGLIPDELPKSNKALVVLLTLTLDSFDAQVQPYLPRLGIFQGGAFENVLQSVTEIPDEQWRVLRGNLESNNLMLPEILEGVTIPYLKFHPSLIPVLKGRLSPKEKPTLKNRYLQGYYELSNFLFGEESQNPAQTRAIEQKELPNFLNAIRNSVENGVETGEDWMGSFIDNVKSFLSDFGLKFDEERGFTKSNAHNFHFGIESENELNVDADNGNFSFQLGSENELTGSDGDDFSFKLGHEQELSAQFVQEHAGLKMDDDDEFDSHLSANQAFSTHPNHADLRTNTTDKPIASGLKMNGVNELVTPYSLEIDSASVTQNNASLNIDDTNELAMDNHARFVPENELAMSTNANLKNNANENELTMATAEKPLPAIAPIATPSPKAMPTATPKTVMPTTPITSQEEFLARSKEGEQLYAAAHYQEAQTIFQGILNQLGKTKSYARCVTLGWLGRCLAEQENPKAENYFQQALLELAELKPSQTVQREIARMQTYLATVLRNKGEYDGARKAYETALPIMRKVGDTHSEAAIQDQLGILATLQGNLPEAEQRHREALIRFQQLNEPLLEAETWFNLGKVHEQAKQWAAAEQSYRQAAQLMEKQGDLAGTAKTWKQLAQVSKAIGNPQEAEVWIRKTIEVDKAAENWLGVSIGVAELADLLHEQPKRLEEARQLAEEAVTLQRHFDSGTVEIWKTYTLLAKIAKQQKNATHEKMYRRLAREAKINSPKAQQDLQRHKEFIDAVVTTIFQPKLKRQLKPMLQQRKDKGWAKLINATRRILAGERDLEKLSEKNALDLEDVMIAHAILQKIENSQSK